MTTLSSKTVTIGGRALRFAALTFRQLDDNKDDIDTMMSPKGANFSDPAARAAIVRVALASLKASAPDVTEDFLRDNLDTFNFTFVITGIFDRNGFLAKPDDDPGEAVAAPSPN